MKEGWEYQSSRSVNIDWKNKWKERDKYFVQIGIQKQKIDYKKTKRLDRNRENKKIHYPWESCKL